MKILFKKHIVIEDLADVMYYMYTESTYNEEGSLQCYANKSRSLEEIVVCAKTYDIDITVEQLEQLIKNSEYIQWLDPDDGYCNGYTTKSNQYARCFYCKDICKQVIRVDSISHYNKINLKKELKRQGYEIQTA